SLCCLRFLLLITAHASSETLYLGRRTCDALSETPRQPAANSTSAIQLRVRRARRTASVSSSNVADPRRSSAGSTSTNAFTLTTAYRWPSILLVTTGTTPHREQIWKSAVRVPKLYLDTSEASSTETLSEPFGLDVQTPPCFWQNVQVHARAGISFGSGSQVSVNEMFPQ